MVINVCAAYCQEMSISCFFVCFPCLSNHRAQHQIYCMSNNQLRCRSTHSFFPSWGSCFLLSASLCPVETPNPHPKPEATWKDFHTLCSLFCSDSLYFTSPMLIMGVIATVIRHHKDNDFIKAPLMDSDTYEAGCYTTQSNTLSPCDNWSG